MPRGRLPLGGPLRNLLSALTLAVLVTACSQPRRTPAPAPKPAPVAPVRSAQVPPEEDPRLPRFDQAWRVSAAGGAPLRDVALAVAPWGDVALLDGTRLSLFAHDTGERIAFHDLSFLMALEHGIGFLPDGALLIVHGQGIDRFDFGSERWDRLLELEDVRRACVRGVDVLALDPAGCTRYRWPELTPIGHARAKAHDVADLALSRDGSRLLTSGRFGKGLELHDLARGERARVTTGEARALVLAEGQLLVGQDEALVPLHPETGRRIGWGYSWAQATGVLPLPGDCLLAYGEPGAAVFPPLAAPLPESTRWWRGKPYRGLQLTASRVAVAAVDSSGRALALHDRESLALYRSDEPLPPRPFSLEGLTGRTPPKPGEGGVAITPEERRAKYATLRSRLELGAGLPETRALPLVRAETFLEGPSTAKEAWFVRLLNARLGGEFDTAGDEEVRVVARLGRRTRVLANAALDLPSDRLGTFPGIGDGVWLELPVAPQAPLELTVYDADASGLERITGLESAIELLAQGFAATPRRQRLPCTTIALTQLLDGARVQLVGAFLDVEWVSAPRRDAPDDESRAVIRGVFGRALEAGPALSRAEAQALGTWLPDAAQAATLVAGRSTHTRVRAVLPELARSAHAVAGLALRYGEPSRSPTLLAEFLEGTASVQSGERNLLRSLEGLAQVELSDPPTAAQLERLIDAALWVKTDSSFPLRNPLGQRASALDTLLALAARERRSRDPELPAELQEAWRAFRRQLAAELK